MIKELQKNIQEYDKDFLSQPIKTEKIEFEERTKVLCFYCAHYNNKWTCPPKIPTCDYRKVFYEFENGLLIYKKSPVIEEYETIRTESSIQLHKLLLHLDNVLLQSGNATRLSFIGGSCKLCKNGCGLDKCRNPYQARIPLEATGVNVIKTAEKAGIEIKFPAIDTITRIGLLLW